MASNPNGRRETDVDDTMKLGLLMEAAHAQQALAENALERLKAHASDLDDIVREEVRRTLVEELHYSQTKASALRRRFDDWGAPRTRE